MTQSPITGFDIYDMDQYVVDIPHEKYAQLRRENPVSWSEEPDGPGFWSVVKHHDVQLVNRDWEDYTSTHGTLIVDWDPETQAAQTRSMLNMDPTRHTRYRLLVNKGFTPRMIGRLKESIVARSEAIIDRVIERGEADLLVDIAAQLPLEVIADMMGVPEADRQKLYDWSNQLIGSDDPEFELTAEESHQAAMEMYGYAHGLAAEKRAHPSDDIISTLVHAEIDFEGEKHQLEETEFDGFFTLLMTAGVETTRNLIATGLQGCFEHPDQWTKLRANPDLLNTTAIEEMLRWSTPIMYFRRTATRDIELRGQQIKQGDKVATWYISANFDEEVFADPLKFDITRSPNEHVTFNGGGPHYCLGANLARVESRAMLDAIVRRMPDLHQTGPAVWLRSNVNHSLKRLPVAWTPTKAATS